MIYIKRTLWLLGYPIMAILYGIVFIVTSVIIGFECLVLYIKNGNIQGSADSLELCVKIIYWYEDIEPKENE